VGAGVNEYRPLEAGPDGVFRSRVFPGLWLDAAALVAGEGAKVMEVLQAGLKNHEHEVFAADLRNRAREHAAG
jgi:hypothetical protein